MRGEVPDDELREIHRLIQQAGLTAYPNPDRIGCPGTKALAEMAHLKRPWEHDAYGHLSHCSPCLKEMLELRGDALARSPHTAQTKSRRLAVVYGLVACLILAALAALIFLPRSGRPETTEVANRTIDLWNAGTLRGEQANPVASISLPASRVRVQVILPRFSPGGRYKIAVCRDRTGNDVITAASALANVDGPREIVTLTLDLRRAKSGAYFLSTTQDEEEASYYYPINVEPPTRR